MAATARGHQALIVQATDVAAHGHAAVTQRHLASTLGTDAGHVADCKYITVGGLGHQVDGDAAAAI
ncbi:hypothetical protein D1872_348700 [compost metagenome]